MTAPPAALERIIAEWIDSHSAKAPMLPCPVDAMTEREAEIFKVAAYHLGFIKFLRSALLTAGTTMNDDGSVPISADPKEAFVGPFAGDLGAYSIPPGKYGPSAVLALLSMLPGNDADRTLEYGEPIEFLPDGLEMPSDRFVSTTVSYRDDHAPDRQKD